MSDPLLLDVGPSDLPEEYRALLDPSVPLAEPGRLVPQDAEEMIGATILVVLSLPVALGLVGMSLVAWGRQILGGLPDPASLYAGPPMALVGLMFSAWALFRWFQGKAQQRAIRDGRWRKGMFVQPGGLLFHDGARCWLIPRSRVARIESEHEVSGGERRVSWNVVWLDDGGQERLYPLPAGTVNGLALSEWKGTGEYAGT